LKRFTSEDASAAVVLSVVCAMRNVAHCVEGFLDSYRRERTVDSQLIVVDGGSTDGTWEILLRHRGIIDVAVSETDDGIYDAWNKALPICTGQYVSFIGADDRIADGGIKNLVAACQRVQSDPHIIAGFNVLTRQGIPVALLGAPYCPSRLCQRMMIAQVMSAHQLRWLVSVRGFAVSFRSAGDYELLLRERGSLRVEVVNVILAYMEDGGISRTALRKVFLEDYRARQRNGVPRWLCAVLLARALLSLAAQRIGLRR
jgi:glycosyltransferase involved in cell wall biosynthesis